MSLPPLALFQQYRTFHYRDLNEVIRSYIKQQARTGRELNILEAGCGHHWPFDLHDIQYTLTGIDINEDALEIRKTQQKDLHKAILGDLRYVDLEQSNYDIIYSCFVLEHVQGAELVLCNFIRWLKPGGLMILMFPNRDSVYGFVTRITPFWFHLFYTKYIAGVHNAGNPGFAPFPTFHDKIISRRVFHEFARKNDLLIKEECGFGKLPRLQQWFTRIIEGLSLGRLASNHRNLMYIIEKKQRS